MIPFSYFYFLFFDRPMCRWYVDNFSAEICYNGEGNQMGRDGKKFLDFFANWWGPVSGGSGLNDYSNTFTKCRNCISRNGLGAAYSCAAAKTFGQTFLLDDNKVPQFWLVWLVTCRIMQFEEMASNFFNQDKMEILDWEGMKIYFDVDEDGADSDDNCIDIANPNQVDIDFDGAGDACDPA